MSKKTKCRTYCAVYQCTSQRTNEKLSFFHLPCDEERGACELPPNPRTGSYTIEAIEFPGGGTGLADFTLLYSCPPGFSLDGYNPRCVSGSWKGDFPSCRQDRKCQLKKHPSVDYECLDFLNLKCPEWIFSGQRVSSACRAGYMLERPSTIMRCVDGTWNHIVTCRPECGTSSLELEKGRQGGVPWHASVYDKRMTPYLQVCGGSLVSDAVVISAAHCFWTEGHGVASAKHYAVGVGKYYRPWNISDNGQKSDVSDIKVPPRFHGATTNYQDDVALVVLATRMVVTIYVRPVCLDFGVQFDQLQLRPGNLGKIAVWNQRQVLQVIEVLSVDVAQCYADLPRNFASFITSDKICAGSSNGSVICRGDSGGGLVFPSLDTGVQRWYLRGVVSTSPRTGHQCSDTYTAFTQLTKHTAFITSTFALTTSEYY